MTPRAFWSKLMQPVSAVPDIEVGELERIMAASDLPAGAKAKVEAIYSSRASACPDVDLGSVYDALCEYQETTVDPELPREVRWLLARLQVSSSGTLSLLWEGVTWSEVNNFIDDYNVDRCIADVEAAAQLLEEAGLAKVEDQKVFLV